MAKEKKGKVKICKKGSEYPFYYEVPGNLSDKEKIAYAKKQHKDRSKKRPYNYTYEVQS